jgi:hypothetical protein
VSSFCRDMQVSAADLDQGHRAFVNSCLLYKDCSAWRWPELAKDRIQ